MSIVEHDFQMIHELYNELGNIIGNIKCVEHEIQSRYPDPEELIDSFIDNNVQSHDRIGFSLEVKKSDMLDVMEKNRIVLHMYHEIWDKICNLPFQLQNNSGMYLQILSSLEIFRRLLEEREKLNKVIHEIVLNNPGVNKIAKIWHMKKSTVSEVYIDEYSEDLMFDVLGIVRWCKQHKKFVEEYDLVISMEMLGVLTKQFRGLTGAENL